MIKIDFVEEQKISEDITILKWQSEDEQFGNLTIKYQGNGHYDIDAEYLSIDTIAEILKIWKS